MKQVMEWILCDLSSNRPRCGRSVPYMKSYRREGNRWKGTRWAYPEAMAEVRIAIANLEAVFAPAAAKAQRSLARTERHQQYNFRSALQKGFLM